MTVHCTPIKKQSEHKSTRRRKRLYKVGLLLILVIAGVFASVRLLPLIREPAALRQLILSYGAWGPAILIIVNILQIIVAPLPGYGVYLAAGWIYGPLWGGIWGSIGMLAGGMLAMGFGRIFGRPLVQRVIGAEKINRWEQIARSNRSLVWFGLLLSPIGDAPFLLAGLTTVSFRKILILTIITRVPAAFAAAALGAGAMQLTWWQLALIMLLLSAPYFALSRHEQQIKRWIRQRLAALAPK